MPQVRHEHSLSRQPKGDAASVRGRFVAPDVGRRQPEPLNLALVAEILAAGYIRYRKRQAVEAQARRLSEREPEPSVG
jgi:hypothetical protein